jgi:ATP-binding cassette subfamily F protein uup
VIAAQGNGRWIEYAGGYTDMLAQRVGSGSRVPPSSAIAEKSTRHPTSTPQQKVVRFRRMSFKDRHALETLPTRIAALQGRIAALNMLLADPGFYARDQNRFSETTTALAAAQAELNGAEEQWLTLELLREQLEATQE